MLGNLDWQARHLATLVDRMPVMADIEQLVKHSTTLIVSQAQHEGLLISSQFAYVQHNCTNLGQAPQFETVDQMSRGAK